MPIYEYECNACGHQLEVIQKMSDALLTDCPECGAAKLRKMISASGFRLKGSGWYETDFKGSGKKNLVSTDTDKPKTTPSKGSNNDKKAQHKSGSEHKTGTNATGKSSADGKAAGQT